MGNLASAVDELQAVDVREASAAQLQDEVADIVRQRHRLDAEYLRRVEAIDRRGLLAEEHFNTQSWLRTESRMSPTTAHRDVRLGRPMADVLPLTAAALADGGISVEHAQPIAGLRRVLTDSALTQV